MQKSTPLIRVSFLRNLVLTILALGLGLFIVDVVAVYSHRSRIEHHNPPAGSQSNSIDAKNGESSKEIQDDRQQ